MKIEVSTEYITNNEATEKYKAEYIKKFTMKSSFEKSSIKFKYNVQDHNINGCKQLTVEKIDEYINLLTDLKKQVENFKI